LEHGTYPHNKWWYCAAGKQKKRCNFVLQILQYFSPLLLLAWHLLFFLIGATPGIYPTGNLDESHQRIKGSSTIPKKINRNCSMSNLVSTQLPNLIKSEGERMSNLVAGCKEFYHEPSVLALVLARLFRKDVDLHEKLDKAGNVVCYYAITRMRIGFPVAQRLDNYNKALMGVPDCFLVRKGSKKSTAVADIIAATRSICKITVKRNNQSGKTVVVGDCKDCIKKLGFDCPGVVVVRHLEGLFGGIPLSTRWLVQDPYGRKSGPQDASGLSGLEKSKSKRKRQPGVYIEDRRELYKSALTVAGEKKFRNFCFMLKLHRHFEEAEPFVGKGDSYFLELILRFDKCPSCFRGCCKRC
jgi:hypothetical protein